MRSGAAVAKLADRSGDPGKLTMSFPRASAQTPIYYNEYSTGRPVHEIQLDLSYRKAAIVEQEAPRREHSQVDTNN